MRQRLASLSLRVAAGLAATGAAAAPAFAGQTMPQMDFRNPLTLDQVGWMAAILVVLYLTLSRWGLPQIGKVLAYRETTIGDDLNAARIAKAQADETVAAMNRTMNAARSTAQAEIAEAVGRARHAAREAALAQQAMLDAQLEKSEAEITAARQSALAAIRPVAAETAGAILRRLTGKTPDAARLDPAIDGAYAASPAV